MSWPDVEADEVLISSRVEDCRWPEVSDDELAEWVETVRANDWSYRVPDGGEVVSNFFTGIEARRARRPGDECDPPVPWFELYLPWAAVRSWGPTLNHALNILLDLFDARVASDPAYAEYWARWADANGRRKSPAEMAAQEAERQMLEAEARAVAEPLEAISVADIDAAQGPMLVEFWAPWCGPCRAVTQTVVDVSEAWGSRVRVAKLDVVEHQEAVERFAIKGIPMVMLFPGEGAAPVHVRRPTREGIEDVLRAHVS